VDILNGSTFRWLVAECADCGARCGEVRKMVVLHDNDAEIARSRQAVAEEWNQRAKTVTET
jgi:hypothetical protein